MRHNTIVVVVESGGRMKKNADKMKAFKANKKVALWEELDKPIEMLELEKSKYELIIEDIIRERERERERDEAMKAAEIFKYFGTGQGVPKKISL